MKKTIILLLILFSTFSIYAQSSIEGIWDTGNDNTKVEIKKIDGKLEGKIASSDNTKATIGKLIIKELQEDGDEYKGKLYAIKKSRWVDAVFAQKGQKLIMTISAGFRSRTVEWVKAD